jgi:hypothetical protein
MHRIGINSTFLFKLSTSLMNSAITISFRWQSFPLNYVLWRQFYIIFTFWAFLRH